MIGVSISSGKCKIYWKFNAMFHWALSFTLTRGGTPSAHYIIYMSWCLDFGLFHETHLKEQWWFMIYVCLLPLYQFINVTIEKLQYYVSFIMIAGITALCMSLNLIKYSLHFKEIIKRNIWFAHKVHWSILVVHIVCVTFY